MMTCLKVSQYRTTSGVRAVLTIIYGDFIILSSSSNISFQSYCLSQEVGLLTKANFRFLVDSFVKLVLYPFLLYSCVGSRAVYLSQLLHNRLHDDSDRVSNCISPVLGIQDSMLRQQIPIIQVFITVTRDALAPQIRLQPPPWSGYSRLVP